MHFRNDFISICDCATSKMAYSRMAFDLFEGGHRSGEGTVAELKSLDR